MNTTGLETNTQKMDRLEAEIERLQAENARLVAENCELSAWATAHAKDAEWPIEAKACLRDLFAPTIELEESAGDLIQKALYCESMWRRLFKDAARLRGLVEKE